ncbi:MAG TPA: hypothetical protein GX010_02210 [Erysipelotrichaceae bacterium]|nr:hypothetical protein [Erysipelotrichaceae bacterium]
MKLGAIFLTLITIFCVSNDNFANDYRDDLYYHFHESKENYEEISLKDSVLFHYYKEYVNGINSGEKAINFIDYKSIYECHDLDLMSYNHELVNNFDSLKFPNTNGEIENMRSSEPADKYMLGTYNYYSIFPYSLFKNGLPFMQGYNYSSLRVGDILIENTIDCFYHCAVIIDPAHQMTNYGNDGLFVQTIEAVGCNPGVQYGYLDDQRIVDHNVVLRRYKSRLLTSNEINLIVDFLDNQVGKDYDLHITYLNTQITSSSWYCTELVWAAYYYADINLLNFVDPNDASLPITGESIRDSHKLKQTTLDRDKYLTFVILGKNWNRWKIRIFNPRNFCVSVEYNTKMCFNNDAHNWQNLNNLAVILINYYSYADISISENWFATTITASYVYNNYGQNIRLISYADELNTNGYLLEHFNYLILG